MNIYQRKVTPAGIGGWLRLTLSLSALLSCTLAVTPAFAQPCPGAAPLAFNQVAKKLTFASTIVCTDGVPSGAATACMKLTTAPTASSNTLAALWPNTALRLGDATGGCMFNCSTGPCRVGNDGLPVELLSFGVE